MMKDVINSINAKFISEAKNSPALVADMAYMEKYMSESYSGRIFVELLQNADDACATKVYLGNDGDNIIFANNGRPFDAADVLSISRSGASQKKRGETIGYRGVGFKSASFLSNDIIIFSAETYFTFSKSRTANSLGYKEDSVPTIRIPFLCEPIELPVINKLRSEGYTTFFIFKSANFDVLKEELSFIVSDLMIFLRNVESIILDILGEEKELSIKRVGAPWGKIIEMDNSKWGIINDSIAIKMDDNTFVACETNEALYYSFLPTYDKALYPIKLNSNFSTDPSRKHIIIDDQTKDSIGTLAKGITNILKQAILNPMPVYKNILRIFTSASSFSAVSMLLKEEIRKIICQDDFINLQDGSKIDVKEYKMFPADFESSIANIVRRYSKYVRKQSISWQTYEILDGVDDFFSKFSDAKYESLDFVKIIEESDFVNSIDNYIYSYLLGRIVKAHNVEKHVKGKAIDISNIQVRTSSGTASIISENLNSDDIRNILLSNDENLCLSENMIKSFAKDNNILYNPILNKDNNNNKNEGSSEIFQINSIKKLSVPIIAKWRSAEFACIEIEEFMGNRAHDVSKQNIGYDVESETPTGEKRYIEVKLISGNSPSFSITNNEYTAAHQYGKNYFICLLEKGETESKAIYLKDPINTLCFEKRIRQWEWICDKYEGEQIKINY